MKLFLQIFLLLTCSLCVFPQTFDEPRLVDEFGKINAENLEARLDSFTIELNNNPNSTAKIRIYRGKDSPIGFPVRYGVRIQTYLVRNRGIQPKRLQIINCGLGNRDLTTFVLFPPNYQEISVHGISCREIVQLPGSKIAFMWDKFWYQLPNDGSDCCVTDNYGDLEKNASLDTLAKKLKADDTQLAVLIFYSYKCVKKEICKYQPSDSTRLANKALKRERNYLIRQHKIPSSRIITINGGFNQGEYSQQARRLEIWTVGKGGKIPKPKPDYVPNQNRGKKK